MGKNPAAIGEGTGALASRNESTGGEIALDYMAASRRVGRQSAGGISLLHVSGGNIDQTDDAGQSVGGFTPRDVAATAAFETEAGPFSAGVSLSYLYSKIIHAAHAVTAGAGAEWKSVDRKTRVGFYATNIAGQFQYVDAKEPLPRSVRAGVRHDVGMVGVVLEGVSPSDDAPYVAGGVELTIHREIWIFALRGGCDGARARLRDGAGGLGAGAGLSNGTWSLDYAWSPGGDIGDDHLFTLGLRFKPSAASAPTSPNPR